MSCYPAVVPVSWQALHGLVLAEWCAVLDRRQPLAAFLSRFSIETWEPGEGWNECPGGYLAEIGWSQAAAESGVLEAKVLRRSPLHARLEKLGCADDGTMFLSEAIVKYCSTDLRGPDPVATIGSHGDYYSRRHSEPRVQVAGTKNRFHFLENFYAENEAQLSATAERSFRGWLVRYRSLRRNARLELFLARLFLGLRALPGVSTTPEDFSWLGSDDELIAGYLTPAELHDLADELRKVPGDLFKERSFDEAELWPLFSDRVTRAAAQGLGLVTLRNGL
jgi:hypothetical protein